VGKPIVLHEEKQRFAYFAQMSKNSPNKKRPPSEYQVGEKRRYNVDQQNLLFRDGC